MLAVLVLALTAAAALSACGNGQEPADLSGDVSFSLQSVCGEDLENGAVTLTTAQYEALVAAQDKAELCEYTLATGASIAVALNDKTLTFAVTAEDGTQKTYSVTLTVLSNDISFVLHDVCGAPVIGDSITMTEEQYRAMRENVG